MDSLTLAGLAMGLLAIAGGQLLEGGSLSSLTQPVALVIVLGGTIGAVLLQLPPEVFSRGMRLVSWVFSPPKTDRLDLIDQMKQWSFKSRREGLLSLENQVPQVMDPFLRKGLQMVVDGADVQTMRSVMEIEINTYEAELRSAAKLWESAGGYSPTIGIIGAVMGLIHVMENLADPAKLGAGIATAFVATIYGVALANLVFLPIGNKIKIYIAEQVHVREMIVEGLASLSVGENPAILERRLEGYLSGEDRPE